MNNQEHASNLSKPSDIVLGFTIVLIISSAIVTSVLSYSFSNSIILSLFAGILVVLQGFIAINVK